MRKLIWVIPVIIVFLSCQGQSKRKAIEENKLSVLIFHDSVIVYNGIFSKKTTYKKYLYTELKKLNEAIEQHRRKYDTQSEILLKIALRDLDGYAELVQDAIEIENQNSGSDFKMADVSEDEQQFFTIGPFKWSILDSLKKPVALDLNMPKGVETDFPVDINTLTTILLNEDSVYCYRGNNLANGVFYSLNGKNTYRVYLQSLKEELGAKLSILIKPAVFATYKTTIDALDEMTINSIKKYSMVTLNEAEKSFLGTKDFSWIPPEPVPITTPGSVISQKLPDANAMLIEIKNDQSVWYQKLTIGIDSPSIIVKAPITKNLKKIIADFAIRDTDLTKQYLIKGDAEARYPVFEKVIEALKQNNIYKYNLVTAITQ